MQSGRLKSARNGFARRRASSVSFTPIATAKSGRSASCSASRTLHGRTRATPLPSAAEASLLLLVPVLPFPAGSEQLVAFERRAAGGAERACVVEQTLQPAPVARRHARAEKPVIGLARFERAGISEPVQGQGLETSLVELVGMG